LQCIIGPIPVLMVYLQGYPHSKPFGSATALAAMLFEHLFEKSVPESPHVFQFCVDQYILQRASVVGMRFTSQVALSCEMRGIQV